MWTTQHIMQEIMAPNNLVGLEVAIFVKPGGETDGEVGCIGPDRIIGQVGGVRKKNIYQKCQTQPKMT